MKIIDIHTHIYPEKIASSAVASIQDFYDIHGGKMNGTEEMLLQRGDEAGISEFLILGVATRPDQVQGINNFVIRKVQGQPRFKGLGTIHAGMENPADEVERITAQGLSGVKLHPDFQTFSIDDPRLFPMYEAMQGKYPVLYHMGDVRYDYSHPERLKRVLELFPNLQTIAAHFGGYSMYETAVEILKDTTCIFDVSSSIMFFEPGQAERYIGIYGAERMAFGSDYPLWDPVTEVKRFLQLDLTDDQFEQIAHKTAERVLGF